MSDLDSLIQPPRFVASEVDLDAAAALTIAAAMREVALCDGEHPREVQLIDTFESQLPGPSSGVDLSTLTTEEHREVFLKSIVLVAFMPSTTSSSILKTVWALRSSSRPCPAAASPVPSRACTPPPASRSTHP